MPWAPAAISALMAVMGTVSAVSQAKQGEAAANKRKEIALAAGQARSAQIAREGERFASTQLAAAGASGADPVSGSSLEVQLETFREIRMQQLDAVYASQLEGYSASLDAAGFRTQQTNAIFGGVNKLASNYASYSGSVSGASIPGGFAGASYSRTRP